MDLELHGKSVLVTGSSRGIGKAIAAAFLSESARVAISGRCAKTLAAAESELLGVHPDGKILQIAGDLATIDHAREAVRLVLAAWERLDILVVNVGSGAGSPGWGYDPQEWDRLFQVNLLHAVRIVHYALETMINGKAGGSIVFINSIAGVESSLAPLGYSSAKAALLNYSKNLSRQVADFGIRVNTVAPGNIFFPGSTWEKHLANDEKRVLEMIDSKVPMRRFGSPQEIADAVLFLSSSRASFITGSCLVADGGQTYSL